MTVICCNRTTMACDTQTTEESGFITYTKKVFRLADGGLLGLSGDCEPIDRYLNWEQKGRKGRPPSIKHIDIIKLMPDGRIITRYSRQIETEVETSFYAIGCGAASAMAAMAEGATPEGAIITTCKINAFCGIDDAPQVEKL